MSKIRPFLKWAGNKYHCIDTLLCHLPSAIRLIEPFAGSASVFMNTDYPAYLIAEENQDLITLYQLLAEEQERFIVSCKTLFTPENNNAPRYYELRHQFNLTTDPHERAKLFLYLNRHGYNGLCRYNLRGKYNVPFGLYRKPYFPYKEMCHFMEKAHCAEFIKGDFKDTFDCAKPGDLIYCDPPYAPRDQVSNFVSYTTKKFQTEEQIHLAELAKAAAGKGVCVIISNHDTEFTRHLYQEATIHTFSVPRFISCQANKRKPAQELLAIFR